MNAKVSSMLFTSTLNVRSIQNTHTPDSWCLLSENANLIHLYTHTHKSIRRPRLVVRAYISGRTHKTHITYVNNAGTCLCVCLSASDGLVLLCVVTVNFLRTVCPFDLPKSVWMCGGLCVACVSIFCVYVWPPPVPLIELVQKSFISSAPRRSRPKIEAITRLTLK